MGIRDAVNKVPLLLQNGSFAFNGPSSVQTLYFAYSYTYLKFMLLWSMQWVLVSRASEDSLNQLQATL